MIDHQIALWRETAQMAKFHIVKGYLLWHLKDGDELAPMLLLKGLSCAELDQRPCLFELFYLLDQQSYNYSLVLYLLKLLTLLKEEVLECKVLLLTECEPLLLAKLVNLLLEFIEESPHIILLFQLILHLVIVGELGLVFPKVGTLTSHFSYSLFEVSPLLAESFHHLRSLKSFVHGKVISFFGLVLRPLVEHFLKIIVQGLSFIVQLLDKSSLLALDLVIELGQSRLEELPH